MKVITLATLPYATAQEVYDHVKNHLLKQNKKALGADENSQLPICKYQTDDGLKCAAGSLIADKEYLPYMEDKSWYQLIHEKLVPAAHGNLIGALQNVHDKVSPERWPTLLQGVAHKFDLNP